jgi:release factor glutamine methyltransferase
MIRQLIKKLTHPLLKYSTKKYFSKPRPYTYEGIKVMVMPEVFPPHYTLSTKILLKHLKQLNLTGKTLLELGCGSGIISLFTASKGAAVTASDINTIALKALQKSALSNNLKVDTILSNLFDNIKTHSFDYIIINPPYYPKAPKNVKEQAWFCGENFEYFEKLFKQLSNRNDKIVLLILSEDCNIDSIRSLANKYKHKFSLVLQRNTFIEKNYIFRIHGSN